MMGPSTEVAIYSTMAGDLYVVLAGWDEFGTVVGFQLFWNPTMSWLWFGGIVLVAGTLFALWPRPERAPAPAERVFEALRELEYDWALGRIPEPNTSGCGRHSCSRRLNCRMPKRRPRQHWNVS